MTSFILSSASTSLPESPSLAILPFSLGPASAPFTGSASTSAYFQPRPCPPGYPIPEGTPIAAFRGRQVVGQELEVPTGYKGVILRTGTRPDRGGLEVLGQSGKENIRMSNARQGAFGEEEGIRRRGRSTHRDQYPLTPATSASSVGSSTAYAASSVSIASSSTAVDSSAVDLQANVRRSPRKSAAASAITSLASRIRGAGQTALSRPKTRQAPKARDTKKRYRLDEDDEEEEGEDWPAMGSSYSLSHSSPLLHSSSSDPLIPDYPETPRNRILRTPSKRQRLMAPQTPHTPVSPAANPHLPSITVQAPTPVKEPLPPPLRHLGGGGRRGKADYVPRCVREKETGELDDESAREEIVTIGLVGGVTDSPDQVEKERPETPEQVKTDPHTDGVDEDADDDQSAGQNEDAVGQDSLISVKEEKGIIPSPATEDDPPNFDISPKSEPQDAVPEQPGWDSLVEAAEQEEEDGQPIRILRPVSTFRSITLWTADAPLPGFRANELLDRDEKLVESKQTVEISDESQGRRVKQEEEQLDAGLRLRKGWWRQGGAGEGGDEVVRAMGEWLGLVEMLNRPVYLEGLDDDEDDDEES